MFLVLDELNKYAPREGWSPIKEVLLDIAERGRSLGLILIGAQQTASEVERRVVANSAIRVVGRLDTAEAERAEYGFLSPVARQRAAILKPGSMMLAAAADPGAAADPLPVPGLGDPRRARSRRSRAAIRSRGSSDEGPAHRRLARRQDASPPPAARRGRRGRSTRWSRSPREQEVDLTLVCGDVFDQFAPSAEAERIVYRALVELRGTGSAVLVIPGNHDNAKRFAAIEQLSGAAGVHVVPEVRRPDAGGIVELASRDGSTRRRSPRCPGCPRSALFGAEEMMGLEEDPNKAYADELPRLLGALCAEL